LCLRKTYVTTVGIDWKPDMQSDGLVMVEVVQYTEQPRNNAVTIQLALDGQLAYPFTVGKDDLMAFETEAERTEFLRRSARTLLDVYGDSRDGRRLSDLEVQERTRH